ncbi:hypothetical protein K504DRAFT_130420 [Pleomassaria siparia CBS 279.74]|uniref:Uncharacterized protein n=1 Tax=Pleomassaria siparia CBS 279.74 TaxID=1314801 RepID=A0A6G1KL59_9PLEO|nr:hypothetical protein K504DRAFT_130420 [Pleomassaria siparia CBS 279.74]
MLSSALNSYLARLVLASNKATAATYTHTPFVKLTSHHTTPRHAAPYRTLFSHSVHIRCQSACQYPFSASALHYHPSPSPSSCLIRLECYYVPRVDWYLATLLLFFFLLCPPRLSVYIKALETAPTGPALLDPAKILIR